MDSIFIYSHFDTKTIYNLRNINHAWHDAFLIIENEIKATEVDMYLTNNANVSKTNRLEYWLNIINIVLNFRKNINKKKCRCCHTVNHCTSPNNVMVYFEHASDALILFLPYPDHPEYVYCMQVPTQTIMPVLIESRPIDLIDMFVKEYRPAT